MAGLVKKVGAYCEFAVGCSDAIWVQVIGVWPEVHIKLCIGVVWRLLRCADFYGQVLAPNRKFLMESRLFHANRLNLTI